MKYILPYHLGSGNRGCEGICLGISKIFNLSNKELVLYNMSQEEYIDDCNLGIDKVGELHFKGTFIFEIVRFICKVINKIGFDKPYRLLLSNYYLSNADSGDVILMTGGDIYCYEGGYILPSYIVNAANKRNIKTVLYCASLEEKYLTDIVVKGLKQYDVIITRESLSKDILDRKGIPNVMIPDPAFSLKCIPVELPGYFNEKPVVGINISPYTDLAVNFAVNLKNLIDYIKKQGMEVCFIPHVFWKGQDDRDSMKRIATLVGDEVHFLDTKKMNYLQIRYVISKCAFFIGGRTHSVISAYCSHVPCLALGYSIKSRGIAKDIGMPDFTVINSKELCNSDVLLNSFIALQKNRETIMEVYSSLDLYCQKSYEARKIVNEMLQY
jgi:polysaccharide pyruvyl transferase WcaK-like protein